MLRHNFVHCLIDKKKTMRGTNESNLRVGVDVIFAGIVNDKEIEQWPRSQLLHSSDSLGVIT